MHVVPAAKVVIHLWVLDKFGRIVHVQCLGVGGQQRQEHSMASLVPFDLDVGYHTVDVVGGEFHEINGFEKRLGPSFVVDFVDARHHPQEFFFRKNSI